MDTQLEINKFKSTSTFAERSYSARHLLQRFPDYIPVVLIEKKTANNQKKFLYKKLLKTT